MAATLTTVVVSLKTRSRSPNRCSHLSRIIELLLETTDLIKIRNLTCKAVPLAWFKNRRMARTMPEENQLLLLASMIGHLIRTPSEPASRAKLGWTQSKPKMRSPSEKTRSVVFITTTPTTMIKNTISTLKNKRMSINWGCNSERVALWSIDKGRKRMVSCLVSWRKMLSMTLSH